MNKKGFMIMIRLLLLTMTVIIGISLMPSLNNILQTAEQSDNLNCEGYVHKGNSTHKLAYNSSLNTNELACLAIDLYIPYLLLTILIGGVALLIGGNRRQQEDFL